MALEESGFDILMPLGFQVRCSAEYWWFVSTVKHPVMTGKAQRVIEALADPEEIRRSRLDPTVYLFYRGMPPRWVCAVAKRDNGEGYLITAYPTDAIKIGETVWKRSE